MTKGNSGSEEVKTGKPSWLTTKPADVEKIVIDLHKQGLPPAKIGLILRDKHGIPKAKLLGKKVKQIIEDAKFTTPAEIDLVQSKIKNLERHGKQHKHDHTSLRSLTKKLWIVSKLTKSAQ